MVSSHLGVNSIAPSDATVPGARGQFGALGEHPTDVIHPLIRHQHRAARVPRAAILACITAGTDDIVEGNPVILNRRGLRVLTSILTREGQRDLLQRRRTSTVVVGLAPAGQRRGEPHRCRYASFEAVDLGDIRNRHRSVFVELREADIIVVVAAARNVAWMGHESLDVAKDALRIVEVVVALAVELCLGRTNAARVS